MAPSQRSSILILRASVRLSHRWAVPGASQYAKFAPFLQKTFYSAGKPVPTPTRGGSKVYKSADDAIADIKDGSVILSAGFGLCGVAGTYIRTPNCAIVEMRYWLHLIIAVADDWVSKSLETLIQAIHRKGLKNLTAVSNNAGSGSHGLALLTRDGRLSRIMLSYLGSNKELEKQYLSGQVAVELCPQGTLAEKLRAAGAGIPAFYTATGSSKPPLHRPIIRQVPANNGLARRDIRRDGRDSREIHTRSHP